MYVVSSAYAVSDPASLSRYTLFITSPQPHPFARHFQGTSLCSQLRAPGTPAPAVIREVPLLQLSRGLTVYLPRSPATGCLLRINRAGTPL